MTLCLESKVEGVPSAIESRRWKVGDIGVSEELQNIR